jgi:putative alpha-1,2-mannosidase
MAATCKAKLLTITVMLIVLACAAGYANEPNVVRSKEPVDYVDPMIGTSSSRWMLYPGPSMPFGMVKLSPDNRKHAWKGGYAYNIENIMAINLTCRRPTFSTIPASPGKHSIGPGRSD